jgi:DNA topoisomerase IA/ssDNA-binding Zn-finger/Zn-ribbon topoisomerase 1
MSTLIISEKNKAAQAIAEALGTVKVIKENKVNVYSIPSKEIFVIPLRGHLLEYRNTDKYKDWKNPPPRDIITDQHAIKKVPISYAGAYIKLLKTYAKIAQTCIIGTDADIEGVNIGLFDALPYIKKVKPEIKVSQLWLSSLQKEEIVQKYQNLISPKYNWGASGEARAVIDAMIGFSATRELTNTLKPLLTAYKVGFTSIGRVQTSLLYLIYKREKEIRDFEPEPYFIIEAILIHKKGIITAQHDLNPFSKENESKAKLIYEKIKNETIAYIIDNSRKVNKRPPPSPLNTSKALVLLTRNLKISADVALKTMNSLYLNKIITYPRTESDIYKSNFNHASLLKKFINHSQCGSYTRQLIAKNRFVPISKGKKDAGDHPPITPLESLELTDNKFENELQQKVYNILSRHYLALFGEDALEAKQELRLQIKEENFTARVVSLIQEGYLEIAPFLKPHYSTEIQISGTSLPIKKINLEKKMTKPPPRYQDPSLLKLMEKNHLGTKSTRPQIIRILQNRKLIHRKKYQYIITDLGQFLIENLIKIWLPFLEPNFTRMVEEKLNLIVTGVKSMDEVIKEVKTLFLNLFDKFLANKKHLENEIKNQIKKGPLSISSSQRKVSLTNSPCPFCQKSSMKFINLKARRFLVCADQNCNKYLSLPKKGRLTLLKSQCRICGFNIFKVSLRKNNKSFIYYLCPKCWNEGLNEKSGKGFCSACENFTIKDGKCVEK